MNKEELVTLLRNQELRKIVFDTNALFSLKRFFDVCDRVDELNKQFQFKLEVFIPALVYFEKLYDLRQKLGDKYDKQQFVEILEEKQVQIMPFEPNHAEAVATLLYSQFSTKEAWQTAKIERCIKCLGIPINNTSKNKSCSATIDWLIAGYAVAEKCLLITDDKGIEFKEISCKTYLEILEQGLCELLNATPCHSCGKENYQND